jgi:hypothetical protein
MGKPEFIGIWLALKVAGQWKRWSGDESGIHGRGVFNVFLIGSAFSVIYALTGAKMTEWLQSEDKLQLDKVILAPAVLVITTLIIGLRVRQLATQYQKTKERVLKCLVKLAKDRQTTVYSKLAEEVGLKINKPAHRNRLTDILGAISEEEFSKKRPLLSAVVISKGRTMPGGGFFKLAEKLGLYKKEDDKKLFFDEQLKKVYEYWS